ncbi:putative transmembrane protein [Toxoplasma gondii RUB]|uniref:Putative transmembrane protein n=2 Tax=Toxoplasma gondii TaxID=5811 RepID=A0A2G8Y1P5_TOXGO|nr:putative transmembrane protein [Toxoplasma gondii RUB]PIM01195.1 putative transmembrane protein [Toxoplasma gondii COUG]
MDIAKKNDEQRLDCLLYSERFSCKKHEMTFSEAVVAETSGYAAPHIISNMKQLGLQGHQLSKTHNLAMNTKSINSSCVLFMSATLPCLCYFSFSMGVGMRCLQPTCLNSAGV